VAEALSPAALEEQLRGIGRERYHHVHPFHRMLHTGACCKGQIQAWALNRYYYQAMIPRKDAALIARCDDIELRREWRKRLEDQDGGPGQGGVARWLKLTEGLGLDPEIVRSMRFVLPATRFAVEAYLHFVRERTLLESVASALTELFSPQIIADRLGGMLAHYNYISAETMSYFRERPPQAERDACYALDYIKVHARSAAEQQAVRDALIFKCNVLWAMLDALHHAYVTPGLIPPGAFIPAPNDD
jgi:coenzyme PQQ biosynthesis protein C